MTLTSLGTGPDGCLALDLTESAGTPERLYLCVPAAEFPFAAGDSLELIYHTEALRLVRTIPGGERTELAVVSGAADLFAWGGTVSVSPACAATGARYGCGAYVTPAQVSLWGLAPGATGDIIEGTVDPRTGVTARVVVGRAERVIIAREGCGAGRDTLGDRVDLLFVYREGA